MTKHKSSTELALMSGEEIVEKSESVEKFICGEGQVENIFFNPDNVLKQCAQGSLANLLHMLKCSQEELDLFWHLVHSDNVIIEKQFGGCTPKKADIIEKCTWILLEGECPSVSSPTIKV